MKYRGKDGIIQGKGRDHLILRLQIGVDNVPIVVKKNDNFGGNFFPFDHGLGVSMIG